jgi:hypothetical protein
MRATSTFIAALIHTSGPDRGVREEIELRLFGAQPPESLRRPVNVDGAPSFEELSLESLDEWTAEAPVALYKLAGHSRRDPNIRPDATSGRMLPWRR